MGKLVKRFLACVMVAVCTAGFALPAHAQATLDDILKRVEALEKENASLKAEVMALKDQQSSQAVKIAAVQAAPASAPLASTGNFIKTKLDIELYGFIMAQGSYATSDMASSNAPNVAPKETSANGDQDEFNMGGHDTRLGFNIKGPDLEDGGKMAGKIEIDFANAQTATYTPRLRLAYVQLDHEKWAVNAGQSWDIIAPLNPNTLNPAIMWRQGNTGYRHPQVHVINKWGDVLGGKLTTKTGILDTDDATNEDSGIPVLAQYAGYETKVLGMPATFNVGGLWGEVETSGTTDHSLWALTAGMTLKMTDWLAFKAEGFSGAKLDDFFGGSAVGMSTVTALDRKPFRVKGGFAELTYNPLKKVEMNFGAGIDMINDDIYISPTDAASVYEYNAATYANLKYNLSKELQVGLEYEYLQTEWVDGSEGDANRIMSAVIYKF